MCSLNFKPTRSSALGALVLIPACVSYVNLVQLFDAIDVQGLTLHYIPESIAMHNLQRQVANRSRPALAIQVGKVKSQYGS